VLPELLYERVIEVDERIGAHGEVCGARRSRARRAPTMRARHAKGMRAVAIVLMHGYRYPRTSGGGDAGARDRLHAGLGVARRSAR
jgi:5-oxoprolinase (ATP-hydrolysing)